MFYFQYRIRLWLIVFNMSRATRNRALNISKALTGISIVDLPVNLTVLKVLFESQTLFLYFLALVGFVWFWFWKGVLYWCVYSSGLHSWPNTFYISDCDIWSIYAWWYYTFLLNIGTLKSTARVGFWTWIWPTRCHGLVYEVVY